MLHERRRSRRRVRTWLFLVAVLLGLPCGAAHAGGRPNRDESRLEAPLADEIRALVGDYETASKSTCGVVVIDLRSREGLVDIRGAELFTPASNQKALTSAFAVASLGKDFEFVTEVYQAGPDIVVVGGGDPTLGDPYIAGEKGASIYREMDRWAGEVLSKVGPSFQGDLLVAGRFEPEDYRHPDWPAAQRDRWYCAPVAALNFNDNCFDVTFKVNPPTVQPNVSPESSFIKVDSAIEFGRKQLWSLKSDPTQSVVHLAGTVSQSSTEPLSVAAEDPPMLAGRVLAGRLVKAGIDFHGQVRKVKLADLDMAGARLLARTATPLSDVLRRCNKRSLNMAAECMFLRAGDGTWAGSAARMRETLIKEFGLPPDEIAVCDGSGLSKGNRISPRAYCMVLSQMVLRDGAEQFLKSLPRSGTDGSLDDRLADKPYAGRVLAKTGYVSGANCLSGYVLEQDYRVALAFSVLVRSVEPGKSWAANALQDTICRDLVGYLDDEATTSSAPAATQPTRRQSPQPHP